MCVFFFTIKHTAVCQLQSPVVACESARSVPGSVGCDLLRDQSRVLHIIRFTYKRYPGCVCVLSLEKWI